VNIDELFGEILAAGVDEEEIFALQQA